MNTSLHQFWLKVTAVVVGSFAPVFFLGTIASSAEPARLTLDMLSWPIDGAQSFQDQTTRFLSALTGGFLMGWGVLIWCLSGAAYEAAPEAVRKSVVTGLLAWFVLDSAGSAASGNASNVLFNIAVLLIAVGPLWRKASE
ncbi:MAG: hypothetical protein AB8C46_05355 [Burkholderiaceae bacterium]